MNDGPQHLTGYPIRDYGDLIARLAVSRQSQGITLAEMADRIGNCYLQQVHNWLNGVECRAHRAFDLADALGFDLALIPRTEPDREAAYEPEPVVAATIASVMAIVDAPYRPGLDVRLEGDENPSRGPLSATESAQEPSAQGHTYAWAPKRRIRACVEAWPDAETGAYDPRCCRFPKSCSATAYDPEQVTDEYLEDA